MERTYRKPIGIQVVAWIEVVWGALVVIGGILISQTTGNANVDAASHTAFGFFASAIGVFMIAAGLGLRALRRWAFVTNLAYLGMMVFSGLASGRIFEVVIAGAIMAYLLKVREAFYVRDDAQNLSLLQESKNDTAASLHCTTSATN